MLRLRPQTSCAALPLAVVALLGQVAAAQDSDSGGKSAVTTIIEYSASVLLVCFSGLFSGLTLGLMGLDLSGLEIVMNADPDSDDAQYARKIAPIRANGNLLLCTLLLGNVAVNALLSILLADIAGGLIGFLVSTAVITIFGEIVPQSTCSRYALAIGARSAPVVRVIMFLLYPVAWPMSAVLDRALGDEMGTIHNKSQLMELLKLHVRHNAVDAEEADVMTGALKFKSKTVAEVMTAQEEMFMLHVDARLNFETLSAIFKAGYSRIPVYGRDHNEIVGLLFTKDLILLDPQDNVSVRHIMQLFSRSFENAFPDMALGDLLKLFKQGRCHLAIVRDVNNEGDGDPFYEVKGLVTLENIIEEILQDSILDEYDEEEASALGAPLRRSDTIDPARLRLLDSTARGGLGVEECRAVASFLLLNVQPFSEGGPNGTSLKMADVVKIVSRARVVELAKPEPGTEAAHRVYTRNRPERFCTLVLRGKLRIEAGREAFVSEAGPWSLLCPQALTAGAEGHAPDFTCTVATDTARCLFVSRSDYLSVLSPGTAAAQGPVPEADAASNTRGGALAAVPDDVREAVVEAVQEGARAAPVSGPALQALYGEAGGREGGSADDVVLDVGGGNKAEKKEQ